MYVISQGQKQPLNSAESYQPDQPVISPATSPTSGAYPTTVKYQRNRRSMEFWLRWVGIFVLLAVGFYYLCMNAPKKRVNFRPVRMMYRR